MAVPGFTQPVSVWASANGHASAGNTALMTGVPLPPGLCRRTGSALKRSSRCWPSAMSPGTPVCRRHKSSRCWPMKVATSPVNRRFTGCCAVTAKSVTGDVRRLRKAGRCRPGRQQGRTRCGRGTSRGVCPEFRANRDAQMNHESVWNIEPVTHDEKPDNPTGCGGGEPERQ